MHMGKFKRIEEAHQILFRLSIVKRAFQCGSAQNTNDASFVHHRPGAKFAGAHTFRRVMDAHLCRQDLWIAPHDLKHRAATEFFRVLWLGR